jgi:Bacillus/Clostridium GerA spore germination protein
MFFLKKARKQIVKKQQEQKQNQIQSQNQQQQDFLSTDLDQNLQELQNVYKNCMDVVFRPFQIGGKTKAALIYIDGLANIEEIDAGVLTPLMKENNANENTNQHLFLHLKGAYCFSSSNSSFIKSSISFLRLSVSFFVHTKTS